MSISGNSKRNKPSEQCKPHPPSTSASASNKRNVSVGSVQNEQYSLGTEPFHDHENEDEFIVHSNQCSWCLCVFDSHDGSQAVKSLKKYMEKQVFGKPLWDDITKSNKPEKIKAPLADCIQKTDKFFFKCIHPFTTERQRLQAKIPKVRLCSITYLCTVH